MRVVSESQLATVLSRVAGVPRVVVSGNFATLQRDLKMEAREAEVMSTGEKVIEPGRTSEINVKTRPGTDVVQARADVARIVAGVMDAHPRYP